MTAIQSVGTNVPQMNQPQQQVAQYQYYPEILNVEEYPDHYVYTIKDEASGGKKWGVGIGSCIIPGVGQAVNGQWGKAAAFFGGSLATSFLAKSNLMLGGLATLGVCIWSTIDAVKNASGKTKQIVPKDQNIDMKG